MAMSEEVSDDRSDDRSAQPESGLDDEPIAHDTAALWCFGQGSLVAPSTLQPGTRFLDESMSVVEVVESERMSIEGNDAKEEEPALEYHLPRPHGRRQSLMLPPACHVNKGVEFVIDAVHRGDASPDLPAGGAER